MVNVQHCPNATKRVVTVTVDRGSSRYVYKRPIWVDCGECEYCRRKKQKEWASRLNIEMANFYRKFTNGAVYYFTLTISPEWFKENIGELLGDSDDLPIPFTLDQEFNEMEYMVTPVAKRIYNQYVKAHLIDLLRAKRGANIPDMKYYVCSEFGDTGERIHFHGYFFIPDYDLVRAACRKYKIKRGKPHKVNCKAIDGGRLQNPDECYFQALLEYYWSKIGFVEKVSRANARTSFYITKYVTKLKEEKEKNHIPFHRQSNELGLLFDEIIKAVKENRPYFTWHRFSKTYKIPISKYYRVKVATLIGCRREQQESFLAEARALFVHKCSALKHYNTECYTNLFGENIDVFAHEVVLVTDMVYTCVAIPYRNHIDSIRSQTLYLDNNIVSTESNGQERKFWKDLGKINP